jgi:hypothetical protein
MQFIHRISTPSSPEARTELLAMGIVVDASGLLISFDLDEANESWPQAQRWIAARRAVDIVRTEFSQQEIADARWLELVPDWHRGYPQPKPDVFGYREITYDTSEYCAQCGTGLRQEASFQMKGEPKWGRNGILQLNWVFDEYFVSPAVWTNVFEPLGVGYRHVQSTRGTELKTVIQLVVDQEIDVVTEGLPMERCMKCGRAKYTPVTRGLSPAVASKPAGDMVKTRQYFGSGASAFKRIIVSQMLARSLAARNIRGASVRPVAEQYAA